MTRDKSRYCCRLVLVAVMFCFLFVAGCSKNEVTIQDPISVAEVENAQKQWADMLINVGAVHSNGGDYKKAAQNLINQLYAYNYEKGIVLFKPTKAKIHPFRVSKEGALSYFIGDNSEYLEDKGFALAPWVDIKFHNDEMYMHGDMAIAMGEYLFTDTKGNTAKVEYTFGYIRDESGALKIVLHHSSLPYQD
ncbi:hypothetical protein SAMN05660337_2038 [Maridesulfovibrio ferrireducens]|uniref:Phosphoribosyl-AMP cyclohydrolase n=1 Tax=Maridesulfovibrio ferrireducens TaxID=246191 RepID=A0A1G9H7G0_9BACT|nr:hypothetical protein [Maridesulfovibrio ferrireducens]SDL08837.1 hypothetical protein SAMN05660337_2038 [Maridesulfovibrio ferrireducens]